MLTLSTKSNCDTAPAVHWHLSPALCFLLSTLTFYCCLLNWCPTVRSEEHTSHIIRYTGTTEEGRCQNSSCIEQVLVVSELTGPVMNEYLKQYVATFWSIFLIHVHTLNSAEHSVVSRGRSMTFIRQVEFNFKKQHSVSRTVWTRLYIKRGYVPG